MKKTRLNGMVGWQRPALLTALLFASIAIAVAIAGHYTRTNHPATVTATVTATTKEGMMFGFDATSDDLMGGYMDNADADIKNEIRWKVKRCSTTTQADVDRSVNEAKRTQKCNNQQQPITTTINNINNQQQQQQQQQSNNDVRTFLVRPPNPL